MTHHAEFDRSMQQFTQSFDTFKNIFHQVLASDISEIIHDFARPKLNIFGKLVPSTLTAQGMLSNVVFEEKDLIHVVSPVGRIKKITCNYGEICSRDYKCEHIKKSSTNRGRKPKVKKRNVRKNQGNGKYFNSQITFWIVSNNISSKYYKIKLFRNGTIEIPGGLDPSMDDVKDVAQIVADELGNYLAEDVHVVELYSIMRNYKFEVADKKIRINIGKLYKIFINAHNNKHPGVKNITEIKYNIERYPGLIIKFSTPIARNQNKQTTIKMFHSGKVNIDGAISEQCADYYYDWINNFYIKHENEIVYVPVKVVLYSDTDTTEDDSV